jgi:hypothetical protein
VNENVTVAQVNSTGKDPNSSRNSQIPLTALRLSQRTLRLSIAAKLCSLQKIAPSHGVYNKSSPPRAIPFHASFAISIRIVR